MLFINLSSDNICVSSNLGTKVISNQKLEINFPKLLKSIYTENFFDKVFLLNGPGSFTTLRIGCLCINMLNFVFKDMIQILSFSKIDLYKKFVEKGYLPNIGYIFIGQKKNVWRYDFLNDSYEIVPISSIDYTNCFIDQFYTDYGLEKDKMIDISFLDNDIVLALNGTKYSINISQLNLTPQKFVEPNYMISPNIN